MILDKLLNFSEDQALTADAASSKVLDFLKGGDAVGQELTLEVRASVAFAAGAGDTLQIKLQTNDDNGSTWEDVVLSPAVKINGVKAGATLFKVRVPHGLKRYARLYYDVTGTITAGKVYAFLSKEL